MPNLLKGLKELLSENKNIEQAIENNQVSGLFDTLREANNPNTNKVDFYEGCKGNISRQSGYEHRLIQKDFCSLYADSTYEYGIPQGVDKRSMIYADLATPVEPDFYEIKYVVEFPLAILQVENYVLQADKYCPKDKPWKKGERLYAKIFFNLGKKTKKYKDIIAFRALPGVIVYFDNDSERVVDPDYKWDPEYVPSPDIIEEFKKQVRRHHGPSIPALQPAPSPRPVPIPVPVKPPTFEPNDRIYFDTDALWEALKALGIAIILVIFIIGAIASAPATTVATFIAFLISLGLTEQQAKEVVNNSAQKPQA
jgi:hypothetical protein